MSAAVLTHRCICPSLTWWNDCMCHDSTLNDGKLFVISLYAATKLAKAPLMGEACCMQGSNVDVFAAQPGLVQTQLNARKLDHRKLSAVGVDLAAKLIGQSADRASLCLQRPASDPAVAGLGP